MAILVLNCGSSSVKFAVMDPASGPGSGPTSGTAPGAPIQGVAQRLRTEQATLEWSVPAEATAGKRSIPGATTDEALRAIVALLAERGLLAGLAGIGHRVVHGGSRFTGSIAISDEVIAQITECIPLSPLHNPANLAGIAVAQELLPRLPQVAVFDTAFHQSMPPRAYTYAVPREWLERHQVRRYGFHGTSHRFVAGQALCRLGLPADDSALITAHLGNGCSCTAIRNGRSVDTTLGFTPLEGLVMGTRSGSIDPAIVAYMARLLSLSADAVVEILNQRSGLLGLSGLSNDMRTIEQAARDGHAGAQLSLEVFCYVLARAIAGLVVPLGRLDALVFTGGIGEHSSTVRARVIGQLGFLGLSLDATANAEHGRASAGRITREGRPQALVVPTNEELMIALDTAAIIGASPPAALG